MYYGINRQGKLVKGGSARNNDNIIASLFIYESGIWNVYTKPEFRQRGIMTKLFKMILHWKKGYYLYVNCENVSAFNLYSKLEFKVVQKFEYDKFNEYKMEYT